MTYDNTDADDDGVVEANVDNQSVSTEDLATAATTNTRQSLYSAISQGFAVAYAGGAKMKAVDFENFATDDAALQALSDYIGDNATSFSGTTQRGGWIFIPAETSAGNQITIENQVTFGKSDEVVTYRIFGIGQHKASGITTTINDGSPVFRFQGNLTNGVSQRGVRLSNLQFNLNDNDSGVATFIRSQNFKIDHIFASGFTGDAFILDQCVEFGFKDVTLKGNSNTARFIVLEDSDNTSIGTDGVVGPACDLGDNADVGIINNHGSFGRFIFAGHCEGATGTANIVWDQKGGLTIASSASIRGGASTGSADGVFFDAPSGSALMVAGGAAFRDLNGDGVHIGSNNINGSGTEIRISPQARFAFNDGDGILVETAKASGTVPYPDQVNDTVTYPAPAWGNLRFIDGYRPINNGTTTVSAGSTVTETFVGNGGLDTKTEAFVSPSSDPNVDIEYDYRFGWDDANGQEKLILEELSGNGSVDLDWTVAVRDRV